MPTRELPVAGAAEGHAADGRLRHLLSLDGLPRATLERLLLRAEALRPQALHGRDEGRGERHALAGRTVVNLFFEPSTRTRTSFELAARRLGATVVNFDAGRSSTRKGESLADTLRSIEAMGVDAFVVRHATEGTLAELAAAAGPGTHLVNAGEGRSNHPTQGLLDMLTLRRHKGPDLSGLRVTIVGDIRHSRVARSDLHALRTLGVRGIRVCAPPALLPGPEELAGCEVVDTMDAAVTDADAILLLRLQSERMEDGLVPSLADYFRDYGLTRERLALAAADAVVLHPGPMNRGVEIDDAVADGPQSLVLEQVANGVATRMAVLEDLLS